MNPIRETEFTIRQDLEDCINYIVEHREDYVNNPEADFTRKRKLPFYDTLKLLLTMQGGTLNRELRAYFNHDCDLTPAAPSLVEARNKIKLQAFDDIFTMFRDKGQFKRTYMDYRLIAVDSTAVNLPTNPDSPTYYEPTGQPAYNQIKLNTLFDLLNKEFIAYEEHYVTEMDERFAFKNMALEMAPREKTLFIGDRGYFSYDVMETVNRMDYSDYLIRVPNNIIKEIKELPMEEWDYDLEKKITTRQTKEAKELGYSYLPGPSQRGKNKKTVTWNFGDRFIVRYRAVRILLPSGKYETLVTSLPRELFSAEEIRNLYGLRWGIETSYRNIKYAIGLANMHSRKEDFCMQEILLRMVLYNLASRMILLCIVISRGIKHMYEVSFTDAVDIIRNFLRALHPKGIIPFMKRYIEPVRPGRADLRKQTPAKPATPFTYRIAA